MFNFLRKVGESAGRLFGNIGSTLRRFGDTAPRVIRNMGHFVANHHQHIAPLAHGLAVATNAPEPIQRATGMGLALSNAVSAYQRRQLQQGQHQATE